MEENKGNVFYSEVKNKATGNETKTFILIGFFGLIFGLLSFYISWFLAVSVGLVFGAIGIHPGLGIFLTFFGLFIPAIYFTEKLTMKLWNPGDKSKQMYWVVFGLVYLAQIFIMIFT